MLTGGSAVVKMKERAVLMRTSRTARLHAAILAIEAEALAA